MKVASLLILFLLATMATGSLASDEQAPPGVPTLQLRAAWPEQKIETNTVHKLRVPRGGTIDIIAAINPNGVDLRNSNVEIAVDPPIEVVSLEVNGQAAEPSLSVNREISEKIELRWEFQLPWELGRSAEKYRFDVAVQPSASRNRRGRRPGGYNATVAASVTIEQGVSCYDTTMKRRLEQMAESTYCKLETIGKSALGRDMYLLRVTNWEVPAAGKKQLIIIGPQHGDEPSGVETWLDFVHEIITKPANKHYLAKMVFYVLASHNPDGHETSSHWGTHEIDPGNHAYKEMKIPEAIAVSGMLRKYTDQFTDAMGLVHHQWNRDYTLISHMDLVPAEQSSSWQRILNMSIRASNELDVPMYPIFGHYTDEGYTGVRGFLMYELKIPNYTLENTGMRDFNLARTMTHVRKELAIYYATIDQMLMPATVKPKPRPTKKLDLPPGRNYQAWRTDKPPVLDGKLDETCWQGKSIITDFVSTSWRPIKLWDTTVHVTYDDANLYVGFKVPDLTESTVTLGATTREVASQDGCEIMLDTGPDGWSHIQIVANANGAVAAAGHCCGGVPDATYRLKGIEAVGSVADGGIEVRVPLAALSQPSLSGKPITIPIPRGTAWGANFARNAHDDKPGASWVRVGRGALSPSRFNAITFVGPKGE